MGKVNKAYTATANRIARRYGAAYNLGEGPDIQTDSMTIEVETSATIEGGLRRLRKHEGLIYVAVTNKEGLPEALRLTAGSRVGVMDPQGNIIRQSQVS